MIADGVLLCGIGGIEGYSWGGSHLFAGAGVKFAPMDVATLRLQAVGHTGGDVNLTAGMLFHF